jgi:hypothetical protein
MYPPPASAYRPQVQQPQMSNPNSQPSYPPPSTYPYPQYNPNSNTASQPAPTYPGHPGQPPTFPQPTPYTMSGSTAGVTNQQNNNTNGQTSVSMIHI